MSDRDWTRVEVEAIVADYLAMLSAELRQEPVNKSAHRRLLKPLLRDRNDSAIERKHMNISAVLIEHGYPYVSGYKPYPNYQRRLLPEVVLAQAQSNAELQALLIADVDRAPQDALQVDDILSVLVDPPRAQQRGYSNVAENQNEDAPRFAPVIDYLAREARNRSLGTAGELFVLKFEEARLTAAGKKRLGNLCTTRPEHGTNLAGGVRDG